MLCRQPIIEWIAFLWWSRFYAFALFVLAFVFMIFLSFLKKYGVRSHFIFERYLGASFTSRYSLCCMVSAWLKLHTRCDMLMSSPKSISICLKTCFLVWWSICWYLSGWDNPNFTCYTNISWIVHTFYT